jgi:hypothetical protein
MDPKSILDTARGGDAPGTWVVWPLRRTYVRNSILRWSALAVVGFLLLTPAAISILPGILSLRGFSFVFSGIILLALVAFAFGGLSIVVYDIWRLIRADDFWLVITPDDYLKAEPGDRVTYVPLQYIESITLKGVRVAMDTAETPFDGTARGVNPLLRMPVRWSNYRRRQATPSSLAFVDSRTNRPVTVATDASFDDLTGIEYVLSMQVDAKQRQLRTGKKA